MLLDLLQKLHCRPSIVVVVDAQPPTSGRFVDGCELAKALPCPRGTRNELHIELHRAPGNLEWSIIWLRAGTVPLLGDRAHVVTVKELVDGGRRNVSLVMPLQV